MAVVQDANNFVIELTYERDGLVFRQNYLGKIAGVYYQGEIPANRALLLAHAGVIGMIVIVISKANYECIATNEIIDFYNALVTGTRQREYASVEEFRGKIDEMEGLWAEQQGPPCKKKGGRRTQRNRRSRKIRRMRK
jgi:hypothetical protein